jgi:hypothetical protein
VPRVTELRAADEDSGRVAVDHVLLDQIAVGVREHEDPLVGVVVDEIAADDAVARCLQEDAVMVVLRRQDAAVVDSVGLEQDVVGDAVADHGADVEADRRVRVRHVVADERDAVAVHGRAREIESVPAVEVEVADHDVVRRVGHPQPPGEHRSSLRCARQRDR